MSTDWNRMSFLLYAFIGNYAVPLVVLIYFYVLIVKAVVEHEQHLRKAAELMNVKDVSELLGWVHLKIACHVRLHAC